jgi:hypothetical protein
MTKRIILHIGLPKSASTTIQDWALSRRSLLADSGIAYPRPEGGSNNPRHQMLVKGLMNGDMDWLRKTIHNNLCPTLFLSAEGLSWHLQDYSEIHLEQFRKILAPFETVLFFNDREPQPWARSFYRQLIINPIIQKFNYGTSLHYEDFIATERVQFMLDRSLLLSRAQRAYGTSSTVKTTLETDWAGDLCALLGVPQMASDLRDHPRRNQGFGSDLTEFARQINGMKRDDIERQAAFNLFQTHAQSTIDVIGHPAKPHRLNESSIKDDLKSIIEQLHPNSPQQVKTRHQLLALIE